MTSFQARDRAGRVTPPLRLQDFGLDSGLHGPKYPLLGSPGLFSFLLSPLPLL